MGVQLNQKTKDWIFYGWYIVVVAALGSFWGSGVSTHTFGVILKPLTETLSIPRTVGVLGVTVASVVGGILSPLVGRIVDRRGARLPMVVSAAITGAALLALSRTEHVWQYFLLFGIVLGIARPGLMSVGPNTAVVNWFIRKRGRAVSFRAVGAPVGAIVLVPLTQWIVGSYGWRTAWFVLGAGIWLTLLVPTALIMRRWPEDMGLLPDGDPPPAEVERPAGAPRPARDQQEVNWEARDAFKTRAFWLLVVAFELMGLAISGLFIHIFPYFTDRGISPAAASGAVGTFGFAIIASRLLLWSFLLERLRIRYTLMLWGSIMAAAVVNMMLVETTVSAYGAAVFFGIAMGGTAPLSTLVWPQYYGRTAVGTINGVAHLLSTVSNSAGPLMASLAYDTTGSYRGALSFFAAACALAVAVFFLARQPAPPAHYAARAERSG